MKVIDLLNKIANEEEVPKKIAYNNKTYLFDGEISNYVNEYGMYDFLIGEDITGMLNDEIEIVEEDKKIEKLYGEPRHNYTENELYIVGKINEIIDYINKENK